jgi:hypothetical protein
LTSQIELEISPGATAPSPLQIAVNKQQVQIPESRGALTALSTLVAMACKIDESSTAVALSTSEVERVIGPVLSSISPACHWHWRDHEGLTCSPASLDHQHGQAALSEIKRNFLAQSARPPYLLLRRLSILEQLGEIASSPASERASNSKQFCRGLEQSLAEEKPLVMNTTAWQQSFCAAPSWALQEQAYEVGLKYGVAELEFFKNLAAQTTRKGRLTIRIPQNTFEEKELWLKLEAQADVGSGIWQQALLLFSEGKGPGEKAADIFAAQVRRSHQGSWHPLFSTNGEQLKMATLFGLMQTAPSEVSAQAPLPAEALTTTSLISYLSTSLMGESTFSVSNGHFKVLHLPMGHYRYTLYDLPAEDANWAPTAVQKTSRGSIAWNQATPQPTIASWGESNPDTNLVDRL